MTDEPTYDQLKPVGKCIIDKKMLKASSGVKSNAKAFKEARDIAANFISVDIVLGGIEVTECAADSKIPLPLTMDSVRTKPTPKK